MTDVVAELRRLLDEAPPGRWEACGEPGWVDIWGNDGDLYHLDIEGEGTNLSPLIVAMHNDLPKLLAAIEATRAAEAHLTVPVQDFGGYEGWVTERDRLLISQRAALAALGTGGR